MKNLTSKAVMIANLIKQGILEEVETICPECKSKMVRHVTDEPTQVDYAVCPNCGITASGLKLKHGADIESIDGKYQAQLQKQMWQGVVKNSITLGNPDVIFSRRFANFKAENDRAKEIGNQAYILAEQIRTEPLHVMFTGQTGAGKTHLAVAMMYKYLMDGEANKHGILVNFSDYVALKKLAMNEMNGETQRLLTRADKLVQKSEIVILDDIGAERGGTKEVVTATDFETGLLLQFMNAREGKRLIITSNLTSEQLDKKYDQRTTSRIMYRIQGIEFDIPDYREKSGVMQS
ncbi:ATP-binding protein [Pediococcus pentosaceus]|uniref:ATP-binding protein n=1 Tax=Pediococcus pentosaceus TaxID=1255 RepID=UPI0020739C04|nr:ATP-binding protein [Pediococcus pentosaceus]MCM6819371.1 ATP-binding protein [Pediococcus pentosaceus]